MKSKLSSTRSVFCALATMALTPAYAAEVTDSVPVSLEEPTLTQNVLPDGELDGQSGGYATTTTVTQNGTVTGNTLTNSTTGSNEISGTSFMGMSGVATVIQNTGNQVLIQTSTVVNVSLN